MNYEVVVFGMCACASFMMIMEDDGQPTIDDNQEVADNNKNSQITHSMRKKDNLRCFWNGVAVIHSDSVSPVKVKKKVYILFLCILVSDMYEVYTYILLIVAVVAFFCSNLVVVSQRALFLPVRLVTFFSIGISHIMILLSISP